MQEPEGDVMKIAVTDFMQAIYEERQEETCLAALDEAVQKTGFKMPQKWLDSYTGENGRLYLVGDSVISDLCTQGLPGFCCSPSHPCDGDPPIDGKAWVKALEQTPKYTAMGWDKLSEYRLRDRENKPAGRAAYMMTPAVADDVHDSIDLMKSFLKDTVPQPEDVMV